MKSNKAVKTAKTAWTGQGKAVRLNVAMQVYDEAVITHHRADVALSDAHKKLIDARLVIKRIATEG